MDLFPKVLKIVDNDTNSTVFLVANTIVNGYRDFQERISYEIIATSIYVHIYSCILNFIKCI